MSKLCQVTVGSSTFVVKLKLELVYIQITVTGTLFAGFPESVNNKSSEARNNFYASLRSGIKAEIYRCKSKRQTFRLPDLNYMYPNLCNILLTEWRLVFIFLSN